MTSDELKITLRMAVNDDQQCRGRLIKEASELGKKLLRVADDLEESLDAAVNSAGIVQGGGSQIDRLCAELRLHREHVAALRAIAAAQGVTT